MPVMSQFVLGLDKGKGMYFFFLFIKSEAKTPGGLVARPILTSYYKSSHFMDRPRDPYTNYTGPNETILCLDSYQSMCSQLLCGLCQKQRSSLRWCSSCFWFHSSNPVLEKHWCLLCRYIRTRAVDYTITDASIREVVLKILKPNSKLVDFIEAECSKGSWKGIITRLWPNTKYVDVIVTGTMSSVHSYTRLLQQRPPSCLYHVRFSRVLFRN